MIPFELQKAFDTTDHPILVNKMKYVVIAWFTSYLSERKYNININTSYSNPST